MCVCSGNQMDSRPRASASLARTWGSIAYSVGNIVTPMCIALSLGGLLYRRGTQLGLAPANALTLVAWREDREAPFMSDLVFFTTSPDRRRKAEALYARVKTSVLTLLPRATVEHVGSTAVPDLLTKGDLDVQV